MTTRSTTIDSPLGPLTLLSEAGALTGLYMVDQRHRPDHGGAMRDDAAFVDIARQLGEYFAGTRTNFDVPLALRGTEFQRRVWAALEEIPYGETASYGELAATVGSPAASRAVGLANGRNPVGIIVPCHRVVGANGALVGYGGGLDRKRWLLAHEASQLQLNLAVTSGNDRSSAVRPHRA